MGFSPSRSAGLQVLERTVFPRGATIFREGDVGNRAYIVQRGRVEFYRCVDREDILLGSVGAGGIFGEMALIDDQPRMATAIVSEPAVCIVISEAPFQKKLAALDPFLAGVLRILVQNIRSIQDARNRAGYHGTAPAMLPVADAGTGDDSDAIEVA
ncbi:MAG: cyclic nucleotide-binding domain-containing protein [Alphaproteobacteria bacterium]